jgi:hypothetical protein
MFVPLGVASGRMCRWEQFSTLSRTHEKVTRGSATLNGMQTSPREWDRRLPFDRSSPALPGRNYPAPGAIDATRNFGAFVLA